MKSQNDSPQIIAVGHPGGVAPQFHVQYHSRRDAEWLSYGRFQDRDKAEQCFESLRNDGVSARIVNHRVYPTAV